MIKLSIAIKGDSHKMTVNHLLYDFVEISKSNPALFTIVKNAVDQFPLEPGEEAPKITIKATLDWQS